MTGSAYQAMDVLGACDSLYRVGVWGRDGEAIPADPRLADDGKRIHAMDVLIMCESLLKGRGLGKGEQSDDGKRLPSDGRCTYLR